MNSCLEIMTDIIAVVPIPVGTYKFDSPFNVRRPSVPYSSISRKVDDKDTYFSSANNLLDDLRHRKGFFIDTYINSSMDETALTMESGVSVKETSKVSISGRTSTDKVSLSTYHDLDLVRSFVNEWTGYSYFDLFVIDQMENVFVMRGMEPSTSVVVSANIPGMYDIDFEVISFNGIIPVL